MGDVATEPGVCLAHARLGEIVVTAVGGAVGADVVDARIRRRRRYALGVEQIVPAQVTAQHHQVGQRDPERQLVPVDGPVQPLEQP